MLGLRTKQLIIRRQSMPYQFFMHFILACSFLSAMWPVRGVAPMCNDHQCFIFLVCSERQMRCGLKISPGAAGSVDLNSPGVLILNCTAIVDAIKCCAYFLNYYLRL